MQYSNSFMHLFYLTCSPVWCSAFDSHLKLLDRALKNIGFLFLDILINFEKHRNIACLSIIYKILHKVNHLLRYKLPEFAKSIRINRHTAQQYNKAFLLARYNTY